MNIYWATEVDDGSLSLKGLNVLTKSLGDHFICRYMDNVYIYELVLDETSDGESIPFVVWPSNDRPTNWAYVLKSIGLGSLYYENNSTTPFQESVATIDLYSSKFIPTSCVDSTGGVKIATLSYDDDWTIFAQLGYDNSILGIKEDYGVMGPNSCGPMANNVVTIDKEFASVLPGWDMAYSKGSHTIPDGSFCNEWVELVDDTTFNFYRTEWDGLSLGVNVLIDSFTPDKTEIGCLLSTPFGYYMWHQASDTIVCTMPFDINYTGIIVVFKKVSGVWGLSQVIEKDLGHSIASSFSYAFNTFVCTDNDLEIIYPIYVWTRADYDSLFIYKQVIDDWPQRSSGGVFSLSRVFVCGHRIYVPQPASDYYGTSYFGGNPGLVVWFEEVDGVFEYVGYHSIAGYGGNHVTGLGTRMVTDGRLIAYSNGADTSVAVKSLYIHVFNEDGIYQYMKGIGYSWYDWGNTIYINLGWVYSTPDLTSEANGRDAEYRGYFLSSFSGISTVWIGDDDDIKLSNPNSRGFDRTILDTDPNDSAVLALGPYSKYSYGIMTTNNNRFDLTGISSIDGFEVEALFKDLGFIYLFSFDSRVTWYAVQGVTVVERDPYNITLPVIYNIEDLSAHFKTLDLASYTTLDFCIIWPWSMVYDYYDHPYPSDLTPVVPGQGFISLSIIKQDSTVQKHASPVTAAIGAKVSGTEKRIVFNSDIDIGDYSRHPDKINVTRSFSPDTFSTNLVVHGHG